MTSCHVAQAGLEFLAFLSQPPEGPAATTYLSMAVGVMLVRVGAPGVALDRSVNRESNAFIGSILDGVVNTEGDNAAGVEGTGGCYP
ncbi:hypothetical protein AAY473_005043 [Plecturocebus cupreus]